MRLLVTRPQPDAERTVAALTSRGHQVAQAALLRVELMADAALGSGPWSAVVVTSPNALRAFEAHPRRAALFGLPVFAVGRRTADAARAAGFLGVTAAGGDVRELATCLGEWARHDGPRDPLLYLAGEDRSGDLAGALAAHGRIVHTVVVAYRAVKADEFPPASRRRSRPDRSTACCTFAPKRAGLSRLRPRRCAARSSAGGEALLPVRPNRRAARGRRCEIHPHRGPARGSRACRLIGAGALVTEAAQRGSFSPRAGRRSDEGAAASLSRTESWRGPLTRAEFELPSCRVALSIARRRRA